MQMQRRSALALLGAAAGHLLFRARVAESQCTGAPGALDFIVTALSPGILHIAIGPATASPRSEELAVLPHAASSLISGRSGAARTSLPWGDHTVEIESSPRLCLTVARRDGAIRQQISFDQDSTAVRFLLGDRPVFGLGTGGHPMDRRGTRDDMVNGQHEPDLETYGARVPIPFLLSAAGWALFIGQPSGYFDLTGGRGVFEPVEATSFRNVYLLLGETAAEALTQYAHLTGFPHLPPKWALGYQQSHRTLASREEVMDEARTFREKRLPCDSLIYLGTGFCPSGWNTGHGSFTFNEMVFPDPAEMLRELHAQNFKIVLHVVPPGDFHGTVHDTGTALEHPGDARAYWQQHAQLMRLGVDGWWPDEGDRLSTVARFSRNQMYWEGSRQAQPDRRPFALHRNGYAGLQRFGWLWSGDVFSRWRTLHAQIMDGINAGLSGLPYWGSDTGGFVPTDELTPELFVRWFQFSSFCPSFRGHGRAWKLRLPWGWDTGSAEPKEIGGPLSKTWPPEPDLHRADVEEICRRYLNLRYRLLPYLYSAVRETHETGLPLMRALLLAYPDDKAAESCEDQYLWGARLLVAPVYQPGVRERSVYLPPGIWWDYWQPKLWVGGKTFSRPVDLATMPLYVKAGTVLPIGPLKQYTAESTEEPIVLRIYPGEDGECIWYDDDGESFAFERGISLAVRMNWRERSRTLTLEPLATAYGPKSRTLQVEVAGETSGRRIELGSSTVVVTL